jgi:hypothetical protein
MRIETYSDGSRVKLLIGGLGLVSLDAETARGLADSLTASALDADEGQTSAPSLSLDAELALLLRDCVGGGA